MSNKIIYPLQRLYNVERTCAYCILFQLLSTDVTKKVFDHMSHFVNAHRFVTRANPTIQYDTTNPKKHRIYQAAAKRLGITAENNSPIDHDLDRGARHERRATQQHDEEPWIIEPWWGRQ